MDDTRQRRWGLAAIILITGIAIGVFGGMALTPDSEPGRPESSEGTDDGPGPYDFRNGVPVGYEQTEEGAIVAATNFARVMTGVSDNPDVYRRAMRTLAAPAWREQVDELASNTIEFVRERYGSSAVATFSPVRYRLVTFSEDVSTVEVWGVLVASGARSLGIEESWLIATIELAWVEKDWRVVGQGSTVGPTPELLQADDRQSEAVLELFEEYESAPGP